MDAGKTKYTEGQEFETDVNVVCKLRLGIFSKSRKMSFLKFVKFLKPTFLKMENIKGKYFFATGSRTSRLFGIVGLRLFGKIFV